MFQKLNNPSGNVFAVGVLLVAAAAFFAPGGFTWIVPHISLLLGVIMFGMGLTLSADNFKEVFRRPKQVLVGVVVQFTLMPLIAYGLAVGFRLPPDIAAGVILVGCCPGGTSSNVMTMLARGNVPLSVTITSVSTILAPVVTPSLTLLLASKWLPVSAASMFMSVFTIVLLPIGLGLIAKTLFPGAVAGGAKVLPLVSMLGIMAIVGAVVGANQQMLAETGLLLLFVVVLHNGLGYATGYLVARWTGMEFPERKTVAIEVGMQNSGLGAALATAHFSPLAAVPSALFSVWHNLSGSLLAAWWSRKRRGDELFVRSKP